MSFNTLTGLCFSLVLAQFVVIILKTKKHQSFLNQFKANRYSHAMAQLAKTQPRDVFIIRACYLLSGVEVALLIIAHKLLY